MSGFFKPIAQFQLGYVFEDPQEHSISLDGATELFESAAGAVNFGNTFSIALWYKPDALALTQVGYMYEIKEVVGTENVIRISVLGTGAANSILVSLSNSVGANFKLFTYATAGPTQDEWNFYVVTWDGAALLLYLNGVAQTATPTVNDLGVMTDTARYFRIGGLVASNYLSGNVHSGGIWDVALEEEEVASLYNGGNGKAVDWSVNKKDYVSRVNLQHWWRMGHDPDDIGEDYGVGNPHDIMVNAQNISDADRVKDSPGG